ncbi:MAG: M23 family metallopeptidase, partial [Gallionella sp.]
MTTNFDNIVPNATGVSSPFSDYRPSSGRQHEGVDITAPAGSSINASTGGVVVKGDGNDPGGMGNYVVIMTIWDGTPVYTVYGHLQVPSGLENGEEITAGDPIGQVGHTGNATGDVLHYEERIGTSGQLGNWKDGALAVDPQQNYFGFTNFPQSPATTGGAPSANLLAQLTPLLDAIDAMRKGYYDNGTQCVPPDDNFLSGIQKLFHRAEITRSPLVLDLNGDGVSTVAMNAGVHFDQNNNRFSELTGWVNNDDGLLVRDLNSNGQIDGGSELFGNNTTLANGQKAANGFASLAEVDANRDGTVDGTEATAAGIKIWKDTNLNGIADTDELLTLNQAGVGSLATGYAAASTVDAQGNRHSQTGHYTAAD